MHGAGAPRGRPGVSRRPRLPRGARDRPCSGHQGALITERSVTRLRRPRERLQERVVGPPRSTRRAGHSGRVSPTDDDATSAVANREDDRARFREPYPGRDERSPKELDKSGHREGPRWSRDSLPLGAAVCLVCRLAHASDIGTRWRVLTGLLRTGPGHVGLHHSRLAVRPPAPWRGQRDVAPSCATENRSGALSPSAANGARHISRAPVRARCGGGAAHGNRL
jgi:hypothetical protein